MKSQPTRTMITDLHILAELAEQFAQPPGAPFEQANHTLMHARLFKILLGMDAAALTRHFNKHPEQFCQLIAALCQTTDVSIKARSFKLKQDQAARKRPLPQRFKLTPDALEKALSLDGPEPADACIPADSRVRLTA